MSFVTEAYISGSLGQAIYVDRGRSMILDVSKPDRPRLSTGNDISLFFNAALEVTPLQGSSVSIEELSRRLVLETKQFDALDGLLIGMDADHEEAVRRKFIARSERLMSSDMRVARFVRGRFLVSIDLQQWDIVTAQSLATGISAKSAGLLYDILASGALDHLVDEADIAVHEVVGRGAKGAHAKDIVIKSGLLGEIAFAEATGARSYLSGMVFHRDDFPDLKSIDPNGQILTKLVAEHSNKRLAAKNQSKPKRAKTTRYSDLEADLSAAQKLSISQNDASSQKHKFTNFEEAQETHDETVLPAEVISNPIVAAIDRFIERHEQEKRDKSPRHTIAESLEAIDHQITWIEERLQEGNVEASETALVRLIDYQAERSRREHLVKSLTRVADSARKTKLTDFATRVFDACMLLGGEDSAARNARAELFRDLGYYDAALVAFDETIRMFPWDVVSRNARAEVLRDLNRPEEALTALNDTISLFPNEAIPLNARAGVLCDLGRPEEALAALNEAISLFPEEVVARNVRAEVLRDLGRPEEALVALNETINLFSHDVYPRAARAGVLRELGRPEEALAALDEIVSLFPREVVPRNVRAEVLCDLGRSEEALAAFNEIIKFFPRDEVARTARANLLSLMGRHDEVFQYLGSIAETPRTRDDWINFHVLAVSNLRAGRIEDAVTMLKRGRTASPFRDTWSYFDAALAVALLANRDAAGAEKVIDQAVEIVSNAEQRKTFYLLRTHAIVDIGRVAAASVLLRNSATVIPFETFLQKRLAQELNFRVQLIGKPVQIGDDTARRINDAEILKLETRLVTSMATKPGRSYRIAA